MPSLRETQARFMDALLAVEGPRTSERPNPSEPAAQHRSPIDAPLDCLTDAAAAPLDVYRNTVRGNFVDALRSTYPAVWRLVGEDYFRQIARRFQDLRPSRSGDLSAIGEFFPRYLCDLHAADQFSYLHDVARFEWLIEESLRAAEHAPLDLAKLSALAVECYERLHSDLHPTLRLFESRYPVLSIWEANVGSDAEPEVIDLDGGADCLAIMRPQHQLKFHRLTRGEADFLRALHEGATIADAIEAAGALDEEFDAGAALQRLVAASVIVDCR
jgi:hypothetical protein